MANLVKFTVATTGSSEAGVLLAFPENWNGRFVGVGSGGAGGRLDGRALEPYVRQGYAAAMTDLGTSPDTRLAGWNNRETIADFGHRATHFMTIAAKERVKARYGREPDFSYFAGASTGGQQAFSEAQRYPDDYDGILAGVPAHCRARLHAYFLWSWQHLRKADGKELFTKDQERNCREACLEVFGKSETFPGAKGRFISAPRWDDAMIDAAVDAAARLDPSLGDAHLAALRALYSGPRHAATGEKIFDGIPPAAKFAPARSNLYLFNWVFGPDIDYAALDFADDYDRYFAALASELDSEDENLDAFRARGGRMMVYAGTQDSCVPCGATIDYWRRLAERYGSAEAALEFFRLYILPGRDHFAGQGIQELAKPLDALRRWREKGMTPEMEGVSCTMHRRFPLLPFR